MPIHGRLQTPSSDSAVLALGLSKVNRIATGQATSNSGSWFFPDGSIDGSGKPSGGGVIIGPGAGDTGGIGHIDPEGNIHPIFDTTELDEALEEANGRIDDLNKSLEKTNSTLESNSQELEQAKKDVSEALDAANQAKESVDGKNSIYTQSEEPDHTSLTQGDLWYVTNGDGQIVGSKVWNGTEFADHKIVLEMVAVASSVGSTLIKDGAVETDKIAADAINADKIASGSVTADALASNSVTTDALAANSVTVAKLYVTEEMMVELLSAHKIQADEIDLNTLNGTTINGLQINGGLIQTSTSGYRIRIYQNTDNGGVIEFLNGKTVLSQIGFYNSLVYIGYDITSSSTGGVGISINKSSQTVSVIGSQTNIAANGGNLELTGRTGSFNGSSFDMNSDLNINGNLFVDNRKLFTSGAWSGSANSNGQFSITHNLGVTPSAFIVTPYMRDGLDVQMRYFQPVVWALNSRAATVRLKRADNQTWSDAQAYQCFWMAVQ